MNATRVILSSIFLMILSSQASADEETQLCKVFKDSAVQINKTLPSKADHATENSQFVVNCATKTVLWVKRLLVDHNKFQSGRQERQLVKHHQLHCNKVGLASQHGWTARTRLHQTNYNYLMTIETTPQNCN